MTNNSRGTFPLAGILDDEYARILDNFTLVKTVVYKKKGYGTSMLMPAPTSIMKNTIA